MTADQPQPWTPEMYGYPLVEAVRNHNHIIVSNQTQARFCEMRARCEGKEVKITVAPYDYPAALAYFRAHPSEIRDAVHDWAHPFAYLFRSAAPDGATFTGTEMLNGFGNLTAIKQGCSTYDDYLAVEIRGDALIPDENAFVGLRCLDAWAGYMERLDAHWVEVAARLAGAQSAFAAKSFAEWVLPHQRNALYQVGATYKYDADARCQAELGIGIADLNRQAATALMAEWKTQPVWSAR